MDNLIKFDSECNKLCRICGCSVNEENSLLPLYDDSGFEQIANKIQKYLPIKLSPTDGLPKKLCMNCINIICSWHILYTCCLETENNYQCMLDTRKQSEEIPNNKSALTNSLLENIESNCCYFCDYKAKDKTELDNHLRDNHCENIFCCDVCNTYKPRDILLRHMNEHALNSLKTVETKKSSCKLCKKKFANQSGVKYHMNAVHNEVKHYECENCNQKFSCKRILSNHIKSMHIKRKDYVCDVCSKAFKTDSSLYIHKKTHSNNRPFTCVLCQKTYKLKHHFTSHLKKHGTNKDFECNICHKKFYIQNLLVKHLKIHNENQVYNCHVCGAKLQQRRYLKQHMKRVHRMV